MAIIFNSSRVQFQVRPQEDSHKHDNSAKCTGHLVSPSAILRAIRISSPCDGVRLSVRGLRSLCVICGAGGREVGHHCWGVQLLSTAVSVSISDVAVSADAKLEGFAAGAVDSWMLPRVVMVRTLYKPLLENKVQFGSVIKRFV